MLRWLAVLLVAVIGLRCSCRDDVGAEPVRFATFNIEDFPKSDRQVAGAFAEIAALEVGFIAVQEIGEPALLLREARQRLGARWEFVHIDTRPIGETRRGHHIGVLFDSRRWKLVTSRAHEGTRLDAGRHKPTLDVHLRGAGGDVRVLVVHLKSGSDGREIRARQLVALGAIVRDVMRAGSRVVLLGDFNATSSGDRDDIAELARDTGLVWASEPLACTAFWNRRDGCPRSQLDHVLTWDRPHAIKAAGACEREGCAWQESCPLAARDVSDHCPVVVTF